MKKRIFVLVFLMIVILTGSLALAGTPIQKAGTKQPTLQEPAKDFAIIKQKMGQLGFQVGKVTRLKNGIYLVSVGNYRPKTKPLSKTGTFSPFKVKAKVVRGGQR